MGAYVIAEAGVNHNGDIDMAYSLIDEAIKARADAVKFQTFRADKLVTKEASKADYQIDEQSKVESQYEMLKRLELPEQAFIDLASYCRSRGIDFLSTAFDTESLSFLHGKLGLHTLKIPSGELTNSPFVLEHARTGRDIILSTGMADLDEIKLALSIIGHGYLSVGCDQCPSRKCLNDVLSDTSAIDLLRKKVTLLHCTTEYPAPIEEVNLKAMMAMNREFGLNVGYSDHTMGITVSTAAVALGAVMIEKHFTLDRGLAGPDHAASLEPSELREMVAAIRIVEASLGAEIKKPTKKEEKNKLAIRKSIFASRSIKKGQVFTSDNLAIMRPGIGLSPEAFWELLGTKASKDYSSGDAIEKI